MSWDPSRAVCGALVTAAPMVATRDVSQRLWEKKPGCSVRKAQTESQAGPMKDISKIHSYCYSKTTHPWWREAAFALVRVLSDICRRCSSSAIKTSYAEAWRPGRLQGAGGGIGIILPHRHPEASLEEQQALYPQFRAIALQLPAAVFLWEELRVPH